MKSQSSIDRDGKIRVLVIGASLDVGAWMLEL
jgi:hypothetical protein